jgi:hypothetical protein
LCAIVIALLEGRCLFRDDAYMAVLQAVPKASFLCPGWGFLMIRATAPSWKSSVTERLRVHVPVRCQDALRDLALETIGQSSTPPSRNEASDLSINRPLARLTKRVKHALQDAGLLCDSLDLRTGLMGDDRVENLVMRRIAHDVSP